MEKLKSLSKQQLAAAGVAVFAVVVLLFAALRDSSTFTAPGAAIVSAVAPGPKSVVEAVVEAGKERRTNAIKDHIGFVEDEGLLQLIAAGLSEEFMKYEVAGVIEEEKMGDYSRVRVDYAKESKRDELFVLQRTTAGTWKIDFDASVKASRKAAAEARQKAREAAAQQARDAIQKNEFNTDGIIPR